MGKELRIVLWDDVVTFRSTLPAGQSYHPQQRVGAYAIVEADDDILEAVRSLNPSEIEDAIANSGAAFERRMLQLASPSAMVGGAEEADKALSAAPPDEEAFPGWDKLEGPMLMTPLQTWEEDPGQPPLGDLQLHTHSLHSSGFRASSPLSIRMTDDISLSLIIIDGGAPPYQFSEEDEAVIADAAFGAARFLRNQAPQNDITIATSIRRAQVSLDHDTPGASAVAIENLWRDEAMAVLGYAGPGYSAVTKFCEDARNDTGSDWSYAAFFTKFKSPHPAYAHMGFSHLVIGFNGQVFDMERLLIHETCHIFGAPDEYAGQCSGGGSWGYYGAPNSNCISAPGNDGAKCIMRDSSWELCNATKAHVGFRGAGPQGDGVLTG